MEKKRNRFIFKENDKHFVSIFEIYPIHVLTERNSDRFSFFENVVLKKYFKSYLFFKTLKKNRIRRLPDRHYYIYVC